MAIQVTDRKSNPLITLASLGTAFATVIGVGIAVLVWAALTNRPFPITGSHDRAAL